MDRCNHSKKLFGIRSQKISCTSITTAVISPQFIILVLYTENVMYSQVPIRQNTLHNVSERLSKETKAFFHRILQSLAFVDVDLTEDVFIKSS